MKYLTKVVLVHNSKSGNERKQCPFYNELEKCYGYKPNVKPVFMLGSNADNVVKTQKMYQKKSPHYMTVMMPLEGKNQRQSNDKIEILDDIRKKNKEMMKKINDQHERRGQNKERKIEVMTQLVDAMKKQ